MVHDLAADVLEVHVDPVGRGVVQALAPVGALVVDAGVEAELLDHVAALLRRARGSHDARAAGLADLTGDRAHRAGRRRDDHRLAWLGPADVLYAEIGRYAGVPQGSQ